MFERYTEAARRALFFSRYEVSQLGGDSIEPEHILLGLLRGDRTVARILESLRVRSEGIRQEVIQSIAAGEKLTTSVEIPFSAGTKRVLEFTVLEADGEGVSYIGSEHLLMSILRDDKSTAASILMRHGVSLIDVRKASAAERAALQQPTTAGTREIDAIVAGIRQLLGRLATLADKDPEAQALLDGMRKHLDDVKRRLVG